MIFGGCRGKDDEEEVDFLNSERKLRREGGASYPWGPMPATWSSTAWMNTDKTKTAWMNRKGDEWLEEIDAECPNDGMTSERNYEAEAEAYEAEVERRERAYYKRKCDEGYWDNGEWCLHEWKEDYGRFVGVAPPEWKKEEEDARTHERSPGYDKFQRYVEEEARALLSRSALGLAEAVSRSSVTELGAPFGVVRYTDYPTLCTPAPL